MGNSEYRAVVTFGLNALAGRTMNSDGSAVGAWDPSNAESLLRYTINKGYNIYGWELGKGLLRRQIALNFSSMLTYSFQTHNTWFMF